jgi:hypothetical protein
MQRLLAFICFFFALATPAWAGAQTPSPDPSPTAPPWADPFCSVYQGFDYWDVANNRGLDATSTSYLLGHLEAHGTNASAHVIFFSDADAYEATIRSQALSGDRYFRASTPFLISFPKALSIRYAYVDSYTLDGGPTVKCPREVHAFSKGGGRKSPPDLKTLATFAATYKQPLPALTCGKIYIAAVVMRAQHPRGIQVDRSRIAQIVVFVDTDGSVAKTYVYKSSGVDNADALAQDAAIRSSYVAPQFYCAPTIGEYLFTAEFRP